METSHLGAFQGLSLSAHRPAVVPVFTPTCCRRTLLIYEHCGMSLGVVLLPCSFSRTMVFAFP